MFAYLRGLKTCLITLTIAFLGALLCLTDFGLYLEEEWGLAWLFKLRGALEAPKDVVIVSIDKASAEILRLPENPDRWPRSYYTQLLEKINQQNPAIVAFDIIFSEARDPVVDNNLATVMAANKNVVLSDYLTRNTINQRGDLANLQYEKIIHPIPIFDQGSLGSAPFPLPKTLSTVKQFWAYKNSAGDIPTFPVIVFHYFVLKQCYPEVIQLLTRIDSQFTKQLPENFKDLSRQHNIAGLIQQLQLTLTAKPLLSESIKQSIKSSDWDDSKVRLLTHWWNSLNNPGVLYFNHYGKPGTITTIPFYQAIVSDIVNPELYTDKVVLVGYAEDIQPEKKQGLYTDFSTSSEESISPVEIAATAVANLIDDSWIKPLSPEYQFLILTFWLILLITACYNLPFNIAIAGIIFLTIGYAVSALYLFASHHLWLPFFIPVVLQMPIILAALAISRFLKNKREHRTMFTTISRYLPEQVVSELTTKTSATEIHQYGELVQGVCMATDAGQYTSLSETMTPMALHDLMNSYYAVMFPQVKNHGGIVSDVIGDAMLALWTRSTANEQTTKINACRAALAIVKQIREFNSNQSRQLITRIGLHFGEMRLGNVGSIDHFEYRALGDTVNTATRIENLNKILGTQLLVSANVVENLPNFLTRPLGHFVLKGKTQAISIHELIAEKPFTESALEKLIPAFADALTCLQQYNRQQALLLFQKINQDFPTDGPTAFYLDYIKRNHFQLEKDAISAKPLIIELGNFTNTLN